MSAIYLGLNNLQAIYRPASELFDYIIIPVNHSFSIGTSDPPNNIFDNIQEALDYYYTTASDSILYDVNIFTSNQYELGDKVLYPQPIDDAIKAKQDINAKLTSLASLSLSAGDVLYATGASNLAAVTSSTFGRSLLSLSNLAALSSLIGVGTPTINNGVSRSLNAAFQISSTKDISVNYSVQIAATLTLLAGQTGTISLQISSTSGGTYTEISRFTNGNTGALTIGLNLTQIVIGQLSGRIPIGYYVKLVSSGTATSTYITGQEVIY